MIGSTSQSIPKPGEVSVAHHGILFLDEPPEFKRKVLEVVRQPLEDGQLTISRAGASLTYPARCTLVDIHIDVPASSTRSCSAAPRAKPRSRSGRG